ncbi:pilin [bacterium]|nr:pilin [bacterium]
MRKKITKYLNKRLFVIIGGVNVDVPIDGKWLSIKDVFDDATSLINVLIGLGSVVAVAMIIVGGYTFIFSAGDPEKAEQGQRTLTGAVVGLVVVWIAGMVVKWLLEFVGYTG